MINWNCCHEKNSENVLESLINPGLIHLKIYDLYKTLIKKPFYPLILALQQEDQILAQKKLFYD